MFEEVETREIVANWSAETQAEFLKMIADLAKEWGRPPEFVNVRPEMSKYHLEVFCKVASTFFVDVQTVRVLEIGSYLGESTTIFAKYFDEVLAVDPFGNTNKTSPIDDLTPEFQAENVDLSLNLNLAPVGEILNFWMENNILANHDNIDFCRMTSDDFFYNNLIGPKSSQYPRRRFDLIYVDGDHRYSQQMRDYTNALACLTPEGILAGHDYSWESTKRVIKDMGFDKKPMLVFNDDSFMILPKYMH